MKYNVIYEPSSDDETKPIENQIDEIISISSDDLDIGKKSYTATRNSIKIKTKGLVTLKKSNARAESTDSESHNKGNDKRKKRRKKIKINSIASIRKSKKQQQIIDSSQMKLTDFFCSSKNTWKNNYFRVFDKAIVEINNNNDICNSTETNSKIKTGLPTTNSYNENKENGPLSDDSEIVQLQKTISNKRAKRGVCPLYKIVNGTPFAVDAFRYGTIDGVKAYFLTHFHADHYIGLNKKFIHPLYVSDITARLVIEFIKLDKEFIHIMQLNKPITIDNIQITALEANHCPGAVMFLFKLANGECILHTGDFRADQTMEEYPEFWNNKITTIYLDTTYLSTKYDFQCQMDSIEQTKQECVKCLNKYGADAKVLIVCGSYVIGKERVWMEIAQCFNFKVWLEPTRRRAVECYGNPLILKYLTDDPINAQIHVLTLGSLQYKILAQYLDSFVEHFTHLLAIRPSGWQKNSKPSYGKRISIIGIEYSEHSSYSELRRFIRFLQPKKIISTVPSSGKNQLNTLAVPRSWLTTQNKPERKGYQTSIINFAESTTTNKFF